MVFVIILIVLILLYVFLLIPRLPRRDMSALTKVDYAIDVNTGAHQETDTLEKNGIAVCEILLTEGIVADLFSNHKVLGELILIDRVTNMTSACGVVDAVSEESIEAMAAAGISKDITQAQKIIEYR